MLQDALFIGAAGGELLLIKIPAKFLQLEWWPGRPVNRCNFLSHVSFRE